MYKNSMHKLMDILNSLFGHKKEEKSERWHDGNRDDHGHHEGSGHHDHIKVGIELEVDLEPGELEEIVEDIIEKQAESNETPTNNSGPTSSPEPVQNVQPVPTFVPNPDPGISPVPNPLTEPQLTKFGFGKPANVQLG